MNSETILELKNVTKTYDRDSAERITVLDRIDLSVGRGESLAVVGPSGSGKTTLLNIMGALDVPTEGEVILEGEELSKLDENELALIRNKRIGFVFQLHHLLPQCSVIENCLIPTLAGSSKSERREAKRRALELLDAVGLSDRVNQKPGQLSGGERQRVALVRALVNKPVILLADEPTGSLDSASSDTMANLLVELNRREKVTLIVVTHSMALAERMEKVYELRGGKISLRGDDS